MEKTKSKHKMLNNLVLPKNPKKINNNQSNSKNNIYKIIKGKDIHNNYFNPNLKKDEN